jgi:hypothetical protein
MNGSEGRTRSPRRTAAKGLRRIAPPRIGVPQAERPGHTLQTTALVHELISSSSTNARLADGRTRGHFFAIASQGDAANTVDHARQRHP